MLGFLFGTACLVGLVKTMRGGGWGHHHHHGGWGRHGGGRWGGGAQRWMLRGLFERLQTTPGQEKVIIDAVEEVQATFAKHRESFEKSRSDVATSIKGEHFDQETLNDMFKRHDEVMEEVRRVISGNLAKIHEALDAKQREVVVGFLESGFGFGMGGFGPGGFRGGPFGRHGFGHEHHGYSPGAGCGHRGRWGGGRHGWGPTDAREV